ncbi:class I SAM-dependent methyltransferase [Aegicerativicinus sediminis]|uniref:class I SAM-dependent methyltransferase n=1 Tax=Aegicerativicinus sediminis TaxID=2893202 RepID=UPI001E544DC3|nr:class I SAM-dependent methyltransferase [Aegicerativicinus sediminis]
MVFNKSYIGLRTDLLELIEGETNLILDVGCATGVNGAYLLENDLASVVYGVEFDPDMAKEAEMCNTKVFCGDLNSEVFRKSIINDSPLFDYIIFGDVLEHLLNPKDVLIDMKSRLKENGRIIISVPNIAHLELFIQVYLKGTFPKNPRGIFDKTHLHWFTRKDLFRLIGDSKLKLLTYKRKYRSRDAIGSKFDWKYKLLRKINKDWVTFQHIVVCTHED